MATTGKDERSLGQKTLRSTSDTPGKAAMYRIDSVDAPLGERRTAPPVSRPVPQRVASPPLKAPRRSELPPAPLTPGTLVGGRFVLIQEVGRGSTGIVFEVRHNELGHRVAIKALHPHIVDDPNVMWRFKREAQLTASLKHPNIVSIFDVSQQVDSVYFIVQEFLEGVSFRRLLQQQGMLPPMEVLEFMVPIMGALVAAHHKGIVHRDVKPENIFLAQTESGAVVPKLIDFGLAKIASEKGEFDTQMGTVLGTPSYMSPEQALGMKVDARADVWSMGVVLFEALSGERPFSGDGVATTIERVRRGDPKQLSILAPHVPTELADIVHRAIDRDLSRRFRSMFDLLSATLHFAEKSRPSFSARHAASIPSALVTSALTAHRSDTEPVTVRARRPLSQSQIRAVRTRASFGSELEVDVSGAVAFDTEMLAEQALEMNALARAMDLAEQAIAAQPSSTRTKGRMRLVQSVACRWLGKLVEAERYAQVAYRQLPQGSSRWFAAINNLVVIAGMNHGEFLVELADDLMNAKANKSKNALGAQIAALGQATISLLRVGQPDIAHRSFALAHTLARKLPYDEIDVRVWLDLAEAEIALHAGDHAAYLNLTSSAVESLAARGDARNACLYRVNLGSAYIELGAYGRAVRELTRAITLGEPMRLGFLARVRASLGFALARLGHVREGTEASSAALKSAVDQGDARLEPVCQLYLSECLRLDDRLADAELHATQAVEKSSNLPATHTAALALLANILIQRGEASEALVRSTRAMGILQSSKEALDGEAAIRLAHVRALMATGHRSKARVHLAQARRRLSVRAMLIGDPIWKETFISEIPENRETRDLVLPDSAITA